MLKKILIILMILIFAVGVVSAQDVNNETGVDLELNDDSALAETSNNFTTLQENIDATPDNGEIGIEGTYKNNDSTTISIYKNLTITGKENGATLDGNNLSATMIVIGENANVHLKNLIFTNANGSNVIQSYGTVYLDNCTFINNRALSSVVYLDNGVNTISKCYFSDNQLITSLINAKGQLTISNSTFINAPNDEDNYYDVFRFNAMNALVENTKLYYAPMSLQNSNVTFDNCYLKKCERYEQGRFITDYILSLNCASIHNCTIEATVATIGNHTFKNNRLIGNTHISSYANDTYVEECEFENSTLTINDGGVNNCVFKNSDKAIIGSDGRNITINNCSFTNISSTAILFTDTYDYENRPVMDRLYVNNCNFTNFNRAIRCKSIFASLNDCSFTDGRDTVIDFILKDDGIVDNCKFENVTSRDSMLNLPAF
jgi:hypothetical protein